MRPSASTLDWRVALPATYLLPSQLCGKAGPILRERTAGWTRRSDHCVSRRPRYHCQPGERRSGHRPIEGCGGPSNNRHDRRGTGRNSLYMHGANGREWAIGSGAVGSAWSRPRMVRRQHCRIVYRATRSRCESRDDAVFPAVPTLCRITLVRRSHFRPAIVIAA